MTLYDSSVVIDYLAGQSAAVEYVSTHSGDTAHILPLALFEVYQGEVFKSGPADFAAVDDALSWLTVVDETAAIARAAGELQDALRTDGTPLAARDGFIAGAAVARDERLVVADSDFDVPGLGARISIELI